MHYWLKAKPNVLWGHIIRENYNPVLWSLQPHITVVVCVCVCVVCVCVCASVYLTHCININEFSDNLYGTLKCNHIYPL